MLNGLPPLSANAGAASVTVATIGANSALDPHGSSLFGPSVRRYPTRVLDARCSDTLCATSAASGLFEQWADLDARSGIVDLSALDSG